MLLKCMIKHPTDVKWKIYSLTQRFKITKISRQVQCGYNVESIGLKKGRAMEKKSLN